MAARASGTASIALGGGLVVQAWLEIGRQWAAPWESVVALLFFCWSIQLNRRAALLRQAQLA